MALANPAWTSLEFNKAYELEFDYGRGRVWKGQFSAILIGDRNGLITRGLQSRFVADLARAHGLEIRYGGSPIDRLSLAGSSAALSAAAECVANRLPSPFRPRMAADPFAKSVVSEDKIRTEFEPGIAETLKVWSMGPGESGATEAAIVSTDQTTALALTPNTELRRKGQCEIYLTVLAKDEKPAAGSLGQWANEKFQSNDPRATLELRLSTTTISFATNLDDYSGGRLFSHIFKEDELKAEEIVLIAPNYPAAKPATFKVAAFGRAIGLLCGSMHVLTNDGDNMLNTERTSQTGSKMLRCHMGVCEWRTLRRKRVVAVDWRGVLVEVTNVYGESKFQDGEPSQNVEWDTVPKVSYTFCSTFMPAQIVRQQDGKWLMQVFNLAYITGAEQSTAMMYSEDCHGVILKTNNDFDSFGSQFHYQVPAEPTEATLAEPTASFELVR
ncbi:MAG: hypothetical protein ACOZAM_22340 [Pseudomonadota bacterium]